MKCSVICDMYKNIFMYIFCAFVSTFLCFNEKLSSVLKHYLFIVRVSLVEAGREIEQNVKKI